MLAHAYQDLAKDSITSPSSVQKKHMETISVQLEEFCSSSSYWVGDEGQAVKTFWHAATSTLSSSYDQTWTLL